MVRTCDLSARPYPTTPDFTSNGEYSPTGRPASAAARSGYSPHMRQLQRTSYVHVRKNRLDGYGLGLMIFHEVSKTVMDLPQPYG